MGTDKRLNIVVVMTDTMRPDHLGCYGNAADSPAQFRARSRGEAVPTGGPWISTPNIDRFAANGTIFTRAYAGSFPTVPCRTDLMTGRTVFPHRGWSPLPLDELCLAEVLAKQGYRTQMIFDPPMLTRNGYGFDRGFQGVRWIRGHTQDGYIVDPTLPVTLAGLPEKWRNRGVPWLQHQRNSYYWQSEEDHLAPRTIRGALAWLERNYQHGPFFLYVDTWDPHEPWDAPQYYVDMYDPAYQGIVYHQPEYSPGDQLTVDERAHVRALFAAEVTMVDRWLGRLYDKLDDLALWETTLVVHLSDHGHMLGEHGIQGKPTSGPMALYEELGRIVLLMRHPDGSESSQTSSTLAQPVDVAATVLDVAHIPRSHPIWQGIEGQSLLPVLAGEQAEIRRAAYTSRHPFLQRRPTPVTISTATHSYIYWPGTDRSELYAVTDDPRQERNLIAEQPEVARELRADYLGWLRERSAQMAEWVQAVEADRDWQPDAALAWQGMV